MWNFEQELLDQGYQRIAGIDEAGRGPLAGPVVAAAVILPGPIPEFEGLTDSKKLSEKKRDAFEAIIREHAIAIGVGIGSVEDIDRINILQATKQAMLEALRQVNAGFALIDGNQPLKMSLPQQTIVGGDGKSLSIAAASIIAKVTRDRLMYELDREFPQYGFAKHKGYPTDFHRQKIAEFGLSLHHRKSFRL